MVKQSTLEIERRWLSRLPGPEILSAPGVTHLIFTAVYVVCDEHLELRIRKREHDDGRVDYPVVMKIGSGLSRQESPKLEGNKELFDHYFAICSRSHVKDYWEVVLNKAATVWQKWEISRFWGPGTLSGLILIEIEFDDKEMAMAFSEKDFPVWLKPLIVKEVTDDPRYNGKNLAVNGRPDPE